jgi:putative spermidine/putrescine transport system substrate-binding protein
MTQPPFADPGRRRFTSGVAAATLAAPFFWVRQATAAEQVIVRTPVGVFDDIKRETIYEPFRKETGS